jgi:hypothetical protein
MSRWGNLPSSHAERMLYGRKPSRYEIGEACTGIWLIFDEVNIRVFISYWAMVERVSFLKAKKEKQLQKENLAKQRKMAS